MVEQNPYQFNRYPEYSDGIPIFKGPCGFNSWKEAEKRPGTRYTQLQTLGEFPGHYIPERFS